MKSSTVEQFILELIQAQSAEPGHFTAQEVYPQLKPRLPADHQNQNSLNGSVDSVLRQRRQVQEIDRGYRNAQVFGVLNGEPPEGRPALIRKVFKALNPGGQIVLRDYVLDSDQAGPPEAAIFAVQMLLATDAGGLDTRDDWAW